MKIEPNSSDETYLKIFQALSDPTRLAMMKMVIAAGDREVSCSEIAANFDLGKSTNSYHFKTLREAGLTFSRIEGRHAYVRLNRETFEKYLPNFIR